MSGWPFPSDRAVDRARQVAHQYRNALQQIDPAQCARIDEAARKVGEAWLLPPRFDDDEFVSPLDAAAEVGCSVRAVYKWVSDGALANYPALGKVRVRVGDVRQVDADKRARAR